MRLLLDTHVAFWLVAARHKLTPSEFTVLADPLHDLSVSAVSIWELRIKWNSFYQSGQRKGPDDPAKVLEGARRLLLPVEPLLPEHGAAALLHPIGHSDPFDELLLTIAQETGRKLLTRDKKLRGHPLAYHAN